MNDLISRQVALDEIDKNRQDLLSLGMEGAEHVLVHYGRRVIEELPTIEPKRGKWIYDKGLYRCTACNNLLTVAGWDIPEEQIYKSFKFCPNCGAKMDDDWEEPEINPCRGCDDYDGRGGCKSHGGCGAERSEE